MSKGYRNRIKNRLLSTLSPEEYKRLVPNLDFVSLSFKQIIYAPHQPIEHVYFPNSGIISLVNLTEDGDTVEAATVGNEGMVGIPVLLGADQMIGQAVVQIPGDAIRMRTDVFNRQVTPGSTLHNLLLRYTLALINLISQSVACNRRHSVEERCCRWLLLCHDRVQSNQLPLTQELLSQMLGVRRPSVSVVAAILQRAGLIRYSRGRITILDRLGLEAVSCECYWIVKEEFERLLS